MPLFPTMGEATSKSYNTFKQLAEVDDDGHLYIFGKKNSDSNLERIFYHASMCTCCDNHKNNQRRNKRYRQP